jgi:phosphoribosylformylglycinamidine cyclo-ligase
MRYRDAGVDVARADALKHDIAAAVRSTLTPAVRPLPLGFAGLMEFPPGGGRLLAATLDGVGTKLHVAMAAGRVAGAAADLVYHGANDLLVHGARPLAFLDYIAQSRLDPGVVVAVVEGLARACREVHAVLLGGETAEMPDTYLPDVVDVAGCMLGSVAPEHVLDGSAARAGDVVLGLGASGLHTNGFSLARRIVERSGLALDDPLPGAGASISVADALLAPHRWYGPALLPAVERGEVRALAHVTGGGIGGNLVRVLPEGVRAVLHASAWERPALFRWLSDAGGVPEADARATFNLGIGMIVVCAPERAAGVADALRTAGEMVHEMGALVAGARGVEWRA